MPIIIKSFKLQLLLVPLFYFCFICNGLAQGSKTKSNIIQDFTTLINHYTQVEIIEERYQEKLENTLFFNEDTKVYDFLKAEDTVVWGKLKSNAKKSLEFKIRIEEIDTYLDIEKKLKIVAQVTKQYNDDTPSSYDLVFAILNEKITTIYLFEDCDGDSVDDKSDFCVCEYGKEGRFGCPNTDGDDFYGTQDECPNDYGKIRGCPDNDGDSLINKEDECPGNFGMHELCGCPSENFNKAFEFQSRVRGFRSYEVSSIAYHHGLVHVGSSEGTGVILNQLSEGLLEKMKEKGDPFRFFGFKYPILDIFVKDNNGFITTPKGNGTYELSSRAKQLQVKRPPKTRGIEKQHYKLGLKPICINSDYSSKIDTLVSFLTSNIPIIHESSCLLESKKLDFPYKTVNTIHYNKENRLLILFHQDKTITIYRKHSILLSWSEVKIRDLKYSDSITAIGINDTGDYLYTGHNDGYIANYFLTNN